MLSSTVNGTELGAQEWRYSLFLRYGINPPGLTGYCGSCGAALSIFHDLNCKKGGLIKARHKNLCYGVAYLTGKYFTPTHVHDEPKIFTGLAVCGGKDKSKVKGAPPKEKGCLNGYLLIRDPWTQGTYSIH